MLKISHRPDGKNADVLALILACTTVTDASMNYSTYVPQRPRKSSHRPDGIFTYFARAIAGWRCLRQWWLGDLLIVHHHWQLSWKCACSRSKVPIAPMEKWLTCLPRVLLAQLLPYSFTTVCTCRRDL